MTHYAACHHRSSGDAFPARLLAGPRFGPTWHGRAWEMSVGCSHREVWTFREAVADTAHGLDVVARAPDLLAQALHVCVDGTRRDLRVHAPHVVEERAA